MQSHMQDHESPIKLALSPTTLEDAGIYVYTLSSVQNVCLVLLAVMICAWSIHTFLWINVLTFSYPCYCAPVAFLLSSKQRLGPEEASLFSARLLAARNACMPDRRCCGWGPSLGRFEVKELANQAVTYFNACFSSFLQSLYILHSDFLAPARTRHSMRKLNLMLLSHKGWSSIYARTGLEAVSWMVPSFAIICCHSASLGAFKLWRCDNTSS